MSIADGIFLMSTHNTREIAARFCQPLFDDHTIEEVETFGQERVSVVKKHMSIDTLRYSPPEMIKQIKRDIVGFDPNIMISVYYRKPVLDIEALRDDVLTGVVGLIKTTTCSVSVNFEDPSRYVLNYHAGILILMEDPHWKCWTKERLRLFADIPYKLKGQFS